MGANHVQRYHNLRAFLLHYNLTCSCGCLLYVLSCLLFCYSSFWHTKHKKHSYFTIPLLHFTLLTVIAYDHHSLRKGSEHQEGTHCTRLDFLILLSLSHNAGLQSCIILEMGKQPTVESLIFGELLLLSHFA